jgi:hypothetical protein
MDLNNFTSKDSNRLRLMQPAKIGNFEIVSNTEGE